MEPDGRLIDPADAEPAPAVDPVRVGALPVTDPADVEGLSLPDRADAYLAVHDRLQQRLGLGSA